jgi:hypothetical protein
VRGRRALGEPRLLELLAPRGEAKDELAGCLAHERRRPAASIVQHLVQEEGIRVLGHDLEVVARDVQVVLVARIHPEPVLVPRQRLLERDRVPPPVRRVAQTSQRQQPDTAVQANKTQALPDAAETRDLAESVLVLLLCRAHASPEKAKGLVRLATLVDVLEHRRVQPTARILRGQLGVVVEMLAYKHREVLDDQVGQMAAIAAATTSAAATIISAGCVAAAAAGYVAGCGAAAAAAGHVTLLPLVEPARAAEQRGKGSGGPPPTCCTYVVELGLGDK